ncbi:MAG: FAD-dependent oxidoreductase [Chloroflexi bacterium]|nr:FAD-dependent oxidoreductase [Chloroflexota bacterium]
MKDDPDVVVVGAGIAGASMATVLARAGIEVLLLERSRRQGRHSTILPDVAAPLCGSHPKSCQALTEEAVRLGQARRMRRVSRTFKLRWRRSGSDRIGCPPTPSRTSFTTRFSSDNGA